MIVSSVVFLAFAAIVTWFYIYQIDPSTKNIYSYAVRSAFSRNRSFFVEQEKELYRKWQIQMTNVPEFLVLQCR